MPFALTMNEDAVLSGVCGYLAWEPLVAWALRANGVSREMPGGRQVYSHRLLTKNRSATVVDTYGQLTSGLFFAVEVKRPGGWPMHKTLERYEQTPYVELGKDAQRHLEQWLFLRRVHECGGHAGVAEAPSDAQLIVRDRQPLGLFADHPRGRVR